MRPAPLLTALLLLFAAPEARAQRFADGLGPVDIYARALRNLMMSAVAEFTLTSFDSGGNSQRFELELMWTRYEEGSREDREGILSRALVRYHAPRDLRQLGVLAVNRRDEVDEQYVYLRSTRRSRRIHLQGENIFGTDFSVEDVVPRGISHAEYTRVDDDVVHDMPCYVVRADFKPEVAPDYSRGLFYVEKRHNVPMLIRYWDEAGVETKQLRIDPDGIREVEGLFIPTRIEIHSMRTGAHTVLQLMTLVVNPELPKHNFSPHKLEAWATGATGIPKELYANAHVFQ